MKREFKQQATQKPHLISVEPQPPVAGFATVPSHFGSSSVRRSAMAMNPVQFQTGLSMPEFLANYGTEAKCRRALYRMRWPHGFRCPACQRRKRSTFVREGQRYYQCTACRHQTTLLAGTLFASTKLPLTT